MLSYDWAFDRVWSYADVLLFSVGITAMLAIATISFALILGVVWGAALSRGGWFGAVSLPVADILKCLPPLVLILFGYFFLSPDLVGFAVSSFLVFVVFVGLNLSAFVADLVRAAITNVPREYLQVGQVLGLTERQRLTYIVAPVALRELIPPFAYLGIETVKLTSLASVINVHEMIYVGQGIIVDTSRSLEVWAVVALIYILLIWPTTIAIRRLELRMKSAAGMRSG